MRIVPLTTFAVTPSDPGNAPLMPDTTSPTRSVSWTEIVVPLTVKLLSTPPTKLPAITVA